MAIFLKSCLTLAGSADDRCMSSSKITVNPDGVIFCVYFTHQNESTSLKVTPTKATQQSTILFHKLKLEILLQDVFNQNYTSRLPKHMQILISTFYLSKRRRTEAATRGLQPKSTSLKIFGPSKAN